jgi:hypothetical protein
MFPMDGINVVSVRLHAHSSGRKLSLRHIRNGQELPKIAEVSSNTFILFLKSNVFLNHGKSIAGCSV